MCILHLLIHVTFCLINFCWSAQACNAQQIAAKTCFRVEHACSCPLQVNDCQQHMNAAQASSAGSCMQLLSFAAQPRHASCSDSSVNLNSSQTMNLEVHSSCKSCNGSSHCFTFSLQAGNMVLFPSSDVLLSCNSHNNCTF